MIRGWPAYSYRLYAQIRGLGVCALGDSYEALELAEAELTRLRQTWDVPVRPEFRRTSELLVCAAIVAGVAVLSIPVIYLLGL